MQERQLIIGESLVSQVLDYMLNSPGGMFAIAHCNNMINALRQLKAAPEPEPKVKSGD